MKGVKVSDKKEYRMINVQVAANHRAALKLWKKKLKLSKMDDVIGYLLRQADENIYEAGNRMADIEDLVGDDEDDE